MTSLDESVPASLNHGGVTLPSRIRFRLSGEPMDVPGSLLARWPDTAMYAAAAFAAKTGGGDPLEVEIPRDPKYFRVFRLFMETGQLIVPADAVERQLLIAEAGYYNIPQAIALLMPTSRPVKLNTTLVDSKADSKADAKAEPKAETPDGRVRPSATLLAKYSIGAAADQKKTEATFAIQGDADLHPADTKIRADETAARVQFAKGDDATGLLTGWLVPVFEKTGAIVEIASEPTTYTRLALPYGSMPLVATLREFKAQFGALLMGIDLLGAGLPIVVAGGAVLAALHRFPREPVPDATAERYATAASCHSAFAEDCRNAHGEQYPGRWYRQDSRAEPSLVKELKHRIDALTAVKPKKTLPDAQRDAIGTMAWLMGIAWDEDGAAWHKRSLPRPAEGRVTSRAIRNDETAEKSIAQIMRQYNEAVTAETKAESDEAVTVETKAEAEEAPTETKSKAEAKAETASLNALRRTDVDIFLVTRDPDEATRAILEIHARIAAALGSNPPVLRTDNSVTFILPWPFRNIQVVTRLYHSVEQVLLGFDVDPCCAAYDGTRVLAAPRAVRALATRATLVDPSRQSLTYESRLLKYARRGFAVAIPGVHDIQARVAAQISEMRALALKKANVSFTGLSLLIALFHLVTTKTKGTALRQQIRGTSDYSETYRTHELRMKTQTAARASQPLPFVFADDITAALFGETTTVRVYSSTYTAGTTIGTLSFQHHAPHIQDRVDSLFTGAFHPSTADWYNV
ncbi:MAG: hypothetical protein KGL39_21070 [Patescibacteria group bacterium]|nr:hypothetical protein [Patescibacteria group bacterium]